MKDQFKTPDWKDGLYQLAIVLGVIVVGAFLAVGILSLAMYELGRVS